MSSPHSLTGSCNCGRNRYTITIPPHSPQSARIIFDNSRACRHAQATPLSVFLRVPLSWYASTTYAYAHDETHSAIRKVYTSPNEAEAKRHFCGFCGTPLSYWSESPAEEAEYISLTLGSLVGADLRDLEDMGVLDGALEEEEEETVARVGEGVPWFEALVEGSRLGKMRKSWGKRERGGNGSARYKVEWEIVEWTEGDGEVVDTMGTGKRKIGEVVEEDEGMEH